MILKKRLLKKPGLYLVTDHKALRGRDLFKILKGSLKAGLDIVQFRDKESSDTDFIETGAKIKQLLRNKALFIINDRVAAVLALDADGVHLGHLDMPAIKARKMLGNKKIIGVSVSSLKEALEAQKQPVDYIAIGAIFKTPVKSDYKLVGLNILKQITKRIKVPIVTIGGINEKNIREVKAAGATRIAVVRAILEAKNPYLATKSLLEKI